MSVQRFRKKPVVIEASQWDGTAEGATPIIDWVLDSLGTARYHADGPSSADPECVNTPGHHVWRYCPTCAYNDQPAHIAIQTLEGVMTASPGDWIIRGVQGEFYPCKPDIFATTYEETTNES